jgi:hypothetical protein
MEIELVGEGVNEALTALLFTPLPSRAVLH